MKKTLTAMTLLAGAVSVYSQGAVSMVDYKVWSGSLSSGLVQIFSAQPLGAAGNTNSVSVNGQSGSEVWGNTSNSYSAHPGASVYAGTTLGPGYSVGLLGAYGTVSSYSALSLAAGSVVDAWKNTTAASATANGNGGMWNATTQVGTVAGGGASTGGGSVYTIAIAAWANTGAQGAASTLAQAQADGYAWGVSDMITASLATGTGSPGFLPLNGGLESFSLAQSVPEPSTIALGVIGASTLLFRRRK